MINRQALFAFLAAATAVQNASAFAPSGFSIHNPAFRPTSLRESTDSVDQQVESAVAEVENDADSRHQSEKLIMDIPPTPVAKLNPVKSASSPKAKKGNNPHKEGVFSPIVVAAGTILGEEQLNKIRAKTISLHSDIIKSFVDTSDSAFGKAVLKQLFNFVDVDKSGYLDKEEVARALNLLGFKWLKDKHVEKIFERADANGDLEISLEEFMEEAPKTLRANLIKLAKQNGGDMGLLV